MKLLANYLVIKLRYKLLESAYQYVNEHNRIEVYRMKIEYF